MPSQLAKELHQMLGVPDHIDEGDGSMATLLEAFREMDQDEDGMVSFDEFLAYFNLQQRIKAEQTSEQRMTKLANDDLSLPSGSSAAAIMLTPSSLPMSGRSSLSRHTSWSEGPRSSMKRASSSWSSPNSMVEDMFDDDEEEDEDEDGGSAGRPGKNDGEGDSVASDSTPSSSPAAADRVPLPTPPTLDIPMPPPPPAASPTDTTTPPLPADGSAKHFSPASPDNGSGGWATSSDVRDRW